MKKIAIVVDRLDSGLGIAACGRAEIDKTIEVISALNYASLGMLLRKLETARYDELLFSWRYLLEDLFSDSNLSNRILRLKTSTRIGILIPDYQGLSSDAGQLSHRELSLLMKIDFYHVTNLDLEEKYLNANAPGNFAGVLHDFTAVQEIIKLRKRKLVKVKKILWIGNSNWGSGSGYVDYKGYHRVIKPIQDYFRNNPSEYEVEIVDLAHQRLRHEEVLQKIATSEILLVASDNEGTGLPILEAIGLGTYVITTKVGIAAEVLLDGRVGTIVDQSTDDFLSAILSYKHHTNKSISFKVFDEYFSRAEKEKVNSEQYKSSSINFQPSLQHFHIWLHVKWFLRFLKNLK